MLCKLVLQTTIISFALLTTYSEPQEHPKITCYVNSCECEGSDQSTSLKNLDQTKCKCMFKGNGFELDCFDYNEENVMAVCEEKTKFKSTGQFTYRHCEHYDRATVKLGCGLQKEDPELGEEGDYCRCNTNFCNSKYSSFLPWEKDPKDPDY